MPDPVSPDLPADLPRWQATLRSGAARLCADPLLLILLVALAGLAMVSSTPLARYPALVDWPTIAALTGLLALTKGLETCGALDRVGAGLVRFMSTERSTAMCLVLAAAALSTVLTNDVALFVVVPLTLGVCRLTGMSATRLVVFEALAVNAGSALTPIGNPQNLFLWQGAGVSFGGFVAHMLPLVVLMMVGLLVLTALAFPGRAVQARPDQPPPLDRPLLAVSLGLYLPFLVATDFHRALPAVVMVLAVLGLMRPALLARLDWGLLLVFVLMFVDLRLLAGLDAVHRAMEGLGLSQPLNLYLTGIVASQLISNVPAAIALAEYSRDWRVLAYAVNVGGFGFMLGSLANLIALRMVKDGRAWTVFHVYAVPFLLVAAAAGYGLLFMGW